MTMAHLMDWDADERKPTVHAKYIVDTTGKDQAQISRVINKLVEVGSVVRTEERRIAL